MFFKIIYNNIIIVILVNIYIVSGLDYIYIYIIPTHLHYIIESGSNSPIHYTFLY